MNAPVFEENAGKRFLQTILDNLLFGISVQDENAYHKSVHAGVSIFNLILSGSIIGTSFIPQNSIISIIIPSIVSVVVGIIYLILILIPKKREIGSLRAKLSSKDQFLNIIVQPNNQTSYKIVNSILAMSAPIVFNVISYYTKLPQWPIIFVQMMSSPAYRQINSSMAKYRPIDYFDPALTSLVYTAGFSAISFGNVATSCVFLTLSPFCLMFGMFPQSLCLLYWLPDIICKFLQLPLIGFEAIMVASTTTICYVLAPVECMIIYFFTGLACASFRKNYRVKLAFLTMLSIANVVCGAILYHYQISLGKIQYTIQIVNRDILYYTSIAITAVFSTAYIVVTAINDKRLHYTGKPLKGMIVYYYIQTVASLAITCLQFIETIQIGLYLQTHLNMIFLIRSISFILFRPEAQHKGPFIGLLIELAYKNMYSLAQVSKIGLATLYGSEIYLIIRRMISYFQFTVNLYKYAVKEHENGWQKRIYKFRVLLWIYNGLVIILASIVGMTVLPIAGMPVVQPFHHHPRAFFGDTMSIKKSNGIAKIDGSSEESLEKKDDLLIYNVTAENLILKKNSDLRKLFMRSPYESGDVLLLLHEKQLLFVEVIGRNVFNSSVQAIVYALETQETTCHALERTKMETHAQKPDYYRKLGKKKASNAKAETKRAEEGTSYTVPEKTRTVDVSTIITFGSTPVTSGVVFENPGASQFIGREASNTNNVQNNQNNQYGDLIDDFEVPTAITLPPPRSITLGSDAQQPAPIRRRPAPIMLGEGRTTRTALPPVRDNRQEHSQQHVQHVSRPQQQKDEKFSPMWRYQGKINVSGLEESDFSLTGIFTSQYTRDIVGDVYVKLLYVILLQLKRESPEIYSQATKSMDMIELQEDSELQKVQEKLNEIISQQDSISYVVLKICFLQGCKQVFIQAEQEIADFYDMPASQIANKQLKQMVSEAFRTSVYVTIESISMGDEIDAQNIQALQQLLSQTRDQTDFIRIGELKSVQIESRVQFCITKDMRGIKRTNRRMQWECFKLPSGARNMAWSTVQVDVLFFKATDPERFSAQALPECCKNVLQEAAVAPFGYPLGYYGEATL